MLDEPLGSLDAGLRDRLAIDLRKIIKQVGLTAIYVTHDQHEAFAIADRIAIMNAGRTEQVDTPEMLYKHPRTVFSAQFLGLTNIVPIQELSGEIAQTAIGRFPVVGQPEAILIHPDSLYLSREDNPNTFVGQVIERVFQGESYRLRVELTSEIAFVVNIESGNNIPPKNGDRIKLAYKKKAILALWIGIFIPLEKQIVR